MQWQTSLEAINCCVHNLVWIKWLTWLVVLQNPLASMFSLVIEPSPLKCSLVLAIQVSKLSSGHRTGKSQFPFHSQRQAMPKNVQTTIELLSIYTLAMECSKSFRLGFSSTWTQSFQMYKAGLEKAVEPENKLPASVGLWKKAREFQKNIHFCFIDYAKGFDCVDHNRLWKILEEMGISDHLTCPLRNLYAG